MSFNGLQIDEDESFGPGTDLAFKLFAIVLLAAVLGWASFSLGDSMAKARRSEVIVFGKEAIFKEGSDKLKSKADVEKMIQKQVPMILATMARHEINQILIEGFASAEGPSKFNLDLSRKRGNVILDMLKSSLHYPDQCFIITAYGNANSAIYRKLQEERKIAIESLTPSEIGKERAGLEQERAVKVWGMFDPKSACYVQSEIIDPSKRTGSRNVNQ